MDDFDCGDATPSNARAIWLNNKAVELLKAGTTVRAFELLSTASKVIAAKGVDHLHVDASNITYQFHWEDCHKTGTSDVFCMGKGPFGRLRLSPGGSSSFLYLRGLRVTTPIHTDDEIDKLCPCGYAWIVWYNLAMCCCLLGTRLEEQGQILLRSAFELYKRVQRRVDVEPPSREWNILHMAVLNNQACIYQDFAMHDAVFACLERIGLSLRDSPFVQGPEREVFLLNLQILGSHSLAPAA